MPVVAHTTACFWLRPVAKAIGATLLVKKIRKNAQDYADQIELERSTELEITNQIVGLMMNCRDAEVIVPIYPPQEPPLVEVGYNASDPRWTNYDATQIDIRGDGNRLLVTYRILVDCCNYQQIHDLVVKLGNEGYRHTEESTVVIEGVSVPA
jgi:hypothetical protein